MKVPVEKRTARILRLSTVSLVIGALIWVLVSLLGSTVPLFFSAASTDLIFGGFNRCLEKSISTNRLGFSVAANGKAVAGYSGESVVVCDAVGQHWSHGISSTRALTFSEDGALWVSNPEGLWRVEKSQLQLVSKLWQPTALTQAPGGIVATVDEGVLKIGMAGNQLIFQPIENMLTQGVSLATSSDATKILLTDGKWLRVFDTRSLKTVWEASPCEYMSARWEMDFSGLVVTCSKPRISLAYNFLNSAWDAVDLEPDYPRWPFYSAAVWVQSCDGLPCKLR